MAELDTAIPSTRWMQRCIRDNVRVVVTLSTGETLNGTVRWQDPEFICVIHDDKEILVQRPAIATVRPV